MHIIDRYIFGILWRNWLAITATLTLLSWLIRFLNTMNLVTSSGESVVTVFKMTALVIPEIIFTIAPLSLAIAVIITLNKMNSDSELSILNAAGVSPWRLFRPFIIYFLLAGVFMSVLAFWIKPYTLALWRIEKTHAGGDLVAALLEPGTFAHFKERFIFHFKEADENGELKSVMVKINGADDSHIYYAESGTLSQNGEDIILTLRNGVVFTENFNKPSSDDDVTIQFGLYHLSLTEYLNRGTVVKFKIREYNNRELLRVARDKTDINNAQRALAELHMRLTSFFFIISFAMIAFVMNMRAQTNRQSRILQIGITMVFVLIVRVLSLNFISAANKNPDAIMLIYISALLPIILIMMEIAGLVRISKWFAFIINPLSKSTHKLFYFLFNIRQSPLSFLRKKQPLS